ncbi:MAG: P-loop NTPase fold protein, partial [Vampirovibrionales bacterium]
MHDHPINSSEEDTLGVERFAQNLAQKILTSKTLISSTAIGIVAQWGYGKSSILNLMKEELRKENDKTLLFFDFNPWIYSKRSNLTSEFINTLENKLGKQKWKKVAKPVKRLGQALNPLFPTLSRSTILLLPIITNNPVIMIVTIVIFVLVVIIVWSQTVSPKNLEDCKDAINKSLKDKQVIVFIDDIDRLPADEVMDILRMIISICNFTNCIYVLAYDEDYVIDAIEKACNNEKGKEYLEKIVSFPYKLPKHSNETLIKFLKTGLEGKKSPEGIIKVPRIVEPNHYQQLVETEHCKAVLEKLVPLYLQTPRKIKRLLNAFNTSYMIAGTNLHWGDLLALEALKHYNLETYEVIAKNKKLYLKTYQDLVSYNINKREHTNIEEQRKSLVSDCDIRELVELLLPHYRSIDHYEERRVSHDYFFDNYFNIELNNTVLTEKEIQTLMEVLSKTPEDFTEALEEAIKENRILFPSTLKTIINRVPKMEPTKQETLLEWFFTSLDEYTNRPQTRTNWEFFHNLFINILEISGKGSFKDSFPTETTKLYEWLCRIQNIEILSLFLYCTQDEKSTSLLSRLKLNTEKVEYLLKLFTANFYKLIEDPNYFKSTHPIP